MNKINNFKRDINNPFNIKGFSQLLNTEFIDKSVNLKEIEAIIFKEPYKVKEDIDAQLKKILNNVPLKGEDDSQKTTFSFENKIDDFLDYKESDILTFKPDEDSIEYQLDVIRKQKFKSRARELLRELKLEDVEFDTEPYMKIISNPNISMSALKEVNNLLESELSCHEGKSSVSDFILMCTGFAENYFDGTRPVFGTKPNLEGLSDSMEVTLRKRKIETTNIHREVKEVIGVGSYSQILFDIATNTATTAQKNSRGTTSTQKAMKLKGKLN